MSGQKEDNKSDQKYPVSGQFKVLEGYDIYRSDRLIIALVLVDGAFGRDLRLYRWQLRNNVWKVDLCRMSVADWKWDQVSARARELLQKYEVNRRGKRTGTSHETD